MQGGGINDSVSRAEAVPLQASAGQAALLILANRLPATERQIRQSVIDKARAFITRCEAVGGVTCPISRSFLVRGDRQNRRVDVEVHPGEAFPP
jgi:hypothetical protein